MSFENILDEIAALVPDLRGRLRANESLAPITWFRVGGPAQLFFSPMDEEDLAYFLVNIPSELPVTVIGLGSNLIIRDGGVKGVVIRLGRGFGDMSVPEDQHLRVGTIVPDIRLAMRAADEGIAGLEFYRGIPGSVGGALRMNAGAHGGETKDFLVEARAVDRNGTLHVLKNKDMGYSYRHCSVPDDYIFTSVLYAGEHGEPDALRALMKGVVDYREEKQPVKARTGGSTFKNPDGHSAWKLVDEAGCRGLRVNGVHVSQKHCNFLINDEEATAADIELLGETVRQRVFENSGIKLHWEIRRLGMTLDGDEVIPTLS
ncbi:MAG: UDP-N-acetylmuramate dehydrogenase [bacterium]|nr:UDP-N-acetylmuramate dehydrogenase [bacterium]